MKTRILTQRMVMQLADPDEILKAVEDAFRAYGLHQVQMPPKVYLFYPKYDGDLRTMPAYIEALEATGVKIVNVHVHNHQRGLPTVMATIVLNDPQTGFPIAIMDGTYITALRTGAAGAVAARYLSRENARRIAFVGCGAQAETQLLMTLKVRNLEEVVAYDIDNGRRDRFCDYASKQYGLKIVGENRLEDVYTADIITTTTPVHEPILKGDAVRPGTHINAIGADAPGKQELDPAILLKAKVVIDDWEQASHSGEINVPVEKGLLTREHIHAELGEIVAGLKPGRESDDEITVFDSTGLAIQDIASAMTVYRRAVENSVGVELSLIAD